MLRTEKLIKNPCAGGWPRGCRAQDGSKLGLPGQDKATQPVPCCPMQWLPQHKRSLVHQGHPAGVARCHPLRARCTSCTAGSAQQHVRKQPARPLLRSAGVGAEAAHGDGGGQAAKLLNLHTPSSEGGRLWFCWDRGQHG